MRVTVVIGGASGIGAATARSLVAAGHRVVIGDLPGTGADLDVDVTDEASVEALFERVVTDHGSFTGVVNCAGVSTLSRVVDHDAAEWRRVVDVCLTGAFLVLKHAGRRVADGGSLVSLSSLNATQPGTGLAAYCASKAGLVALTEVTALELAHRQVRVNAVAPGLVVTPLTAPAMDIAGIREDYLENTPLGRSGEPSEIGAAVRFLLSDDAAWITGETMAVNGGAHLKRYPDLVGLIEKAFA
ncbi:MULTISPECIES: SDR family NAD(P)-dependent oxidoreductase [unclassified Nocardioides]|uniref:SDR family NAD(P)-dependent oxidoreductase n=1 Tax=unclassified Nocardioides TaxID=2615069 RepID=UPI0007019FEF|nr:MULTISPECIES: SDR family oxidoreductase [unclassified Nocardioides]KRA31337.1 short-chain dehydrogenase [Nocardioides sp. Root614]KRA87958.1 short-chain dehydrogenase [Nocardioides sp. Root682]